MVVFNFTLGVLNRLNFRALFFYQVKRRLS